MPRTTPPPRPACPPDDGAIIEFIDQTEHAGLTHTYGCEQHLLVDGNGLIVAIRHVELPGEREAVNRFLAAAGVSQPGGRD